MNTELFSQFQKDPAINYVYGTAGFRMNQEILPSVIFSSAVIGILRSCSHGGKAIALMITASHNKHTDNGIKITEPDGEMMSSSWEVYANLLANVTSFDEYKQVVAEIMTKENITDTKNASIIVGRDTRPSGVEFTRIIKLVCDVYTATCQDFDLVTTPQLHHIVRSINDPAYGTPTLQGYHAKLSSAFNELKGNTHISINIDCANGVGALALEDLIPLIPTVKFILHKSDTHTPALLNSDCGADYVKMKQSAPLGLSLHDGEMWASLDGDADRIVFYHTINQAFRLLDGDKIAILALAYFTKLVKEAGLDLRIGIVQTAYANGASTKHVNALGVPVVFTCTGVKHLHHAAKAFDIGVYFEANGHGTVIFSNHALQCFTVKSNDPIKATATEELHALSQLINQCVGDALSDLLLVLVIISKGTTFEEWDAGYTDLPSLQTKILVADKSIFVPGEADMALIEPQSIQQCVDEACKGRKDARCFVRPSGTEDCVRVYSEAETKENVDEITKIVCDCILESFGRK